MALVRKIIGARETADLDTQGRLVRSTIIQYMLGNFGPFEFIAPKAEITKEKIKADMDNTEKLLQAAG